MNKLEIKIKVWGVEYSHAEESEITMSSDYVIDVTQNIVETIIKLQENDNQTKDTE